jgi:hypothetical protein
VRRCDWCVAYAVEEFLDELVRGAVAVSVEHGNGKILSPSHMYVIILFYPVTSDICMHLCVCVCV